MNREMHACWAELMESMGYEKDAYEAMRHGTIKKNYGKNSSTELTDEEMTDFVMSIRKNIEERKQSMNVAPSENGTN
jgi:hypothetical protein